LKPTTPPTLETFRADAQRWLRSVAKPRKAHDSAWGEGSDSVALFDNLDHDAEVGMIEAGKAWERARFDAGWGTISWPVEDGGLGYPAIYSRAFDEEERYFDVPRRSEIFEVTRKLIPPTILKWGTEAQKARWNRAFLRAGCRV
jgi:alkylation response protein AidB-like acyl-CoA dehydrogenase